MRAAGHTVVLVSFRHRGGSLHRPPVPCPEANSVVQVGLEHPRHRLNTTTERLPDVSQVMHVGRRLDYTSAAFERTRQQLVAALSEPFQPRATRPEDPDPAPGAGEMVLRDFSHDLKPGAAAAEAWVCLTRSCNRWPAAELQPSFASHSRSRRR
jgi:hypothetical protein